MEILKLGTAQPFFEHHLFVSYQSGDGASAQALAHALQDGFGLRAWVDRDAGDRDRAPRMADDVRGRPIPGDDDAVRAVLRQQIAFSMIVVVVSSTRVGASVWVREEIALAEQMAKPRFFWHVAGEDDGATSVSARRGGGATPDAPPDEFIESVHDDYRTEFLATPQSADFLDELSHGGSLNVLGHAIRAAGDVAQVAAELNTLVELSELVLSSGVPLNSRTVEEFWPEYERLVGRCKELQRRIEDRRGETIDVTRAPVANGFRLKRPFIVQKVHRLERILDGTAG